ncbi:MAG TPA: GAF domain-containing protein [Conexibacter sp.]
MRDTTDRERSQPAFSPWIGIQPGVDPVRWARVLRRAHDRAAGDGTPPPILRDVIARSWRRAAAAGIDPDRPAPRLLDEGETARRLGGHRLAGALPLITGVLEVTLRDSACLAALSDADGLLLWADGHPRALHGAAGPQFLPGSLCSEQAIGTNAVGTALAIDHAVQVFSAEHFSRLLHGWTCAAAPIHDPETGALLGAIDVSGSFRAGHAHSLALVSAVASAVESELRREVALRDERLKALYLRRVSHRSGQRSALLSRSGRVVAASPRGWLDGQATVPVADGVATLANGIEVLIEPLGRREGYVAWPTPRARRGRVPAVLRLEPLGDTRVRVTGDDGLELELGGRQGEILLLLGLHPGGLTSDELGLRLYGAARNRVTVRAEVSRLRARLGSLLRSNPYRLAAEVRLDASAVDPAVRASWRARAGR